MTLRDAGYLFKVAVYGENGSHTFSVDDGMGFYTNEMAAFVEMIRTRTPSVTREQTLDVLAILHAGIRSAEEKRTVRINEITGGVA
jgi:predicted dehydrogenase